jgi:hypothetical protein
MSSRLSAWLWAFLACVVLLIYTADGYVAVNLMPKGRAWRVDSATLSELRLTVGEGFHGLCRAV